MNALHDLSHGGSADDTVEPTGANELLYLGQAPTRAHEDDAGLDLRYDDQGETVVLQPGQRHLFPTRTKIALPRGTVGYVCPRSGLALKHGITVLNAPGVVDASYRGDVGVILLNTDLTEPFTVQPGDRIAQLSVHELSKFDLVETEILPDPETARGAKGFGSTGVK